LQDCDVSSLPFVVRTVVRVLRDEQPDTFRMVRLHAAQSKPSAGDEGGANADGADGTGDGVLVTRGHPVWSDGRWVRPCALAQPIAQHMPCGVVNFVLSHDSASNAAAIEQGAGRRPSVHSPADDEAAGAAIVVAGDLNVVVSGVICSALASA
jgi:hypothetical protein